MSKHLEVGEMVKLNQAAFKDYVREIQDGAAAAARAAVVAQLNYRAAGRALAEAVVRFEEESALSEEEVDALLRGAEHAERIEERYSGAPAAAGHARARARWRTVGNMENHRLRQEIEERDKRIAERLLEVLENGAGGRPVFDEDFPVQPMPKRGAFCTVDGTANNVGGERFWEPVPGEEFVCLSRSLRTEPSNLRVLFPVLEAENLLIQLRPMQYCRRAAALLGDGWAQDLQADAVPHLQRFPTRLVSTFPMFLGRASWSGEFILFVKEDLLEPARQNPKSAAKGRPPKKGAKEKAKKQERDEAIALMKDDEDDAWFLDGRTGELGDADADFHDAVDTREKTLSAAVQSDLAQARTKKKGGRGRRRRRKRTRRTHRRKKHRTRRRRRRTRRTRRRKKRRTRRRRR